MSVCAWCHDPISAAPGHRPGMRSHGICRPCLDRRLRALEARPLPAGTPGIAGTPALAATPVQAAGGR